jgi:O-antigen ligase
VGEAQLGAQHAVPFALVALGSGVLGVANGGYFEGTWAPSIVAFAAVVVLAVLVSARVAVSRLELAVLALLGAFAGWAALSATWSDDPTASLREAERVTLYLIALLAMLLTTRRGYSIALAGGALMAATFVSVYGLAEYIAARPPVDPFEGTLLFEPLGYANAAGILAAIGIVVALGLALHAPTPGAVVVRASPLAVLVPTLVLTESRGAWAALAIAGVVLIVHRFRLGRPRIAILLAALAVGGGLVVWAAGSGFYGDRPTFWRVAWRDYRDNPVLGSGAGTYALAWNGTLAPSGGVAANAHNLYLETLAELGPAGLALVLGALLVPLPRRRQDIVGATSGAAYIAFLVHAGIDWDWEMPAVTLAGVACAAALLVERRDERTLVRLSGHRRPAAAALVAGIAIAVVAGRALG